MNNPISIILMNIDLLLRQQRRSDTPIDEGFLRNGLQIIEAQANRCGNLVRALLEYARHKPVTQERCDVHLAIRHAIDCPPPR